MSDVPGEYRVTCGECGFDGGTYDFKPDATPPSYCPNCGTAISEETKASAVAGDDEPTGLSCHHTDYERE